MAQTARIAKIAKVVVEKATYSFDRPFDFLIPPELEAQVRPGCRVKVQFGAGSRNRQGMVLAVEETQEDTAA
jgi:primosomal protein N' (replication factor Y)